MRERGYAFCWQLLLAADYDFPNRRARVFFAAAHASLHLVVPAQLALQWIRKMLMLLKMNSLESAMRDLVRLIV